MEIYHQYIKLRKQFGRHPKFSDEGAEMLADIRPDEESAKSYIERNPMSTASQCVPEMSEHDANTTAVMYANKCMSHVEGGWPKDVDYTEAEHTIRYRKKVEKDEDYIQTVKGLGDVLEALVKQNNSIDIYQHYFRGIAQDHSAEVPCGKTITVFKDPSSIKRNASYMHWQPDGTSKVVVSYSIMAFQKQPAGMPTSSYIWDVNNPNTPEFTLTPPSQLCCAKFNNKDSNIIGAGQYNGQITYFDVRKGTTPVDATPVELSHLDPVYDLVWLQSKTGTECMSVSTDGHVHCWDIRKLSEMVESMPLKEKGSDVVLGGVSFEYEPSAGATKFMVGTEQGTILNCNKKAKTPADRVTGAYSGHHGPIYGLKRNPFWPKYFLSVGDWTARIWNEDQKAPLLSTKYHSTYLSGGTWSPTRPGVFFTTRLDGMLDVWDLFYKHNSPTLQVQVSDQAITSFAIQQDSGALCAAGSSDGTVSVLQLSPGLVEAAPNEKSGIGALLDREVLREKNLDKAIKEAKVKAKKDAARHAEGIGGQTSDEQLAALEEEFFKMTA